MPQKERVEMRIAECGMRIERPDNPKSTIRNPHFPYVSVVVPVFNGAGTIAECLQSLLAQAYPRDRYDVIVVDNHSTDETASIIKQHPVRYVFEGEIQSSYAARNRGIREAQGDLIASTDADCVASPQWIAQGVAAFTTEQVGGVAGAIRPREPRTIAQRYAVAKGMLSQETALQENSFRPAVYTANAFYRKTVLEQAGMFDPTVKSGGDADLAWRVQERLHLAITFAPEAIVYHKHRERVSELLRQRKNYGYGSVLNYLKYQDRMGRRTLKHAYWELASFGRKCGRFLKSVGAYTLTLGRGARWGDQAAIEGLDVLAFLAKKAGQLEAAVKNRVWYF